MKDRNMEILIPDEVVMDKIYIIRGQKVMLDRDLAKLYNVETKVLKQAVEETEIGFPMTLCSNLKVKNLQT